MRNSLYAAGHAVMVEPTARTDPYNRCAMQASWRALLKLRDVRHTLPRRYGRQIHDLPCNGYRVRLHAAVWRFAAPIPGAVAILCGAIGRLE